MPTQTIEADTSKCKTIGDLTINQESRTITAVTSTARVRLPSKEFALLSVLTARPGTVLTKNMFFEHLYKGKKMPGFKIFEVYICNLREKLYKISGGENYIETVWGRGYRFTLPESVKSEATLPKRHTRKTRLPRIRVSRVEQKVDLEDGTVLTRDMLPPQHVRVRWTSARKMVVVQAVKNKLISSEEAAQLYGLSTEEAAEWESLFKQGGQRALRATQLMTPVPTNN